MMPEEWPIAATAADHHGPARRAGRDLAGALGAAQKVRSARKERDPVRVLLDPHDPM